MADLPIELDAAASARLAAVLDVEGKIARALEALGPVSDQGVVLIDGSGGLRARQLAALGARLTVLERDAARARALRAALADVDGATVRVGTAGATGLPDASAGRVVSLWSGFRDDLDGDLAEADRILADGGRLLVLHDYGRDDVSRLRGDLPEYGSWSRRDGWFLRNGFRVRVLHCWWTFESIEDAQSFLADTFGAVGRELGEGLRRPRLSYNVAVYHRGRHGEPRPADEVRPD